MDAAEEEMMEVQNEYDSVIKQGRILLVKLFIPAFLMYTMFRVWFYIEVALEPLPFEETMSATSLTIIILLTTISWIFQTTTYLYTCILFATVCALQELKMKKFRDLMGNGLDPEFYYFKYVRIIKGLQATSQRFRLFLALIITITLVGFLASMYKVVSADRAGIDILMSGEIVVLNLVTLGGVGLCLRSSSKLSHLHRRIVKAAASMHAMGTFEATDRAYICCSHGDDTTIEQLSKFCQIQDAWSRRAAFVNFLASSSVGISVYGFVLDRFFIHASVGGLLTTTWFILGRAL